MLAMVDRGTGKPMEVGAEYIQLIHSGPQML